jgi:hypothetical protein
MKRDWRIVCVAYGMLLALACSWPRAASVPDAPKPFTSKSASHPATPVFSRLDFADYDAELRRADGRVDIDALANRLKELGVSTYYWLIWHAPTDWDDLKLFLPKAATAGIDIWVFLVPPSEGSGKAGPPSEPFGLDFGLWAQEIARLSLQQTNLTAWVIDDFFANHATLTPAYIGSMQARAKQINPRLAFLPLMYFDEVHAKFVEDYRTVIDGVVVAYLQDREEIDRVWAVLNDDAVPPASEFVYPWNTMSHEGDFVLASQNANVLPAQQYFIRFRERDNFTGPTAGYHFKQLLVNGTVVWEEDVAGGSGDWRPISVDATSAVRGRTNVTIAFRLLDKKGVSNFGVRWQMRNLSLENLQVVANLGEPQSWQVRRQGAFETGFGTPATPGARRFHIPFISMTAGDAQEFRLRHGDPASPERIAGQLHLSLQAWKEGKCEAVVTYCLDKSAQSPTFLLVQKLFLQFTREVK